MHFRNRAMSSDTFIVRIPSADVPRDLKDEIQGVLAELAPLVTARIKEKRQTDFKSLVDVLLRGVKLRTLDIHRAQQQAKALEEHLSTCPPCITFVRTYRATRRLCRSALAAEMPHELMSSLSSFLGKHVPGFPCSKPDTTTVVTEATADIGPKKA